MGAWLDRLASANRPSLWLDDIAYSERLLASGSAPWTEATALVSWRRKAQGLLKPDSMPLPLAPLSAAWVRENRPLQEQMAAKRRLTAPLRTLLATQGLRVHVAEVLKALRASSPLPLALVVPSPRRWVADAQQLAFGESTPADADATDSAAVHVADFLRCFGERGVDVLLFDEDECSVPADTGELEWYRSAINVARHYGWDVGVHTPKPLQGGSAVDFVVSAGSTMSVEVEPLFWSEGVPPMVAAGGFRYATIPVDADPQAVLERLELLR